MVITIAATQNKIAAALNFLISAIFVLLYSQMQRFDLVSGLSPFFFGQGGAAFLAYPLIIDVLLVASSGSTNAAVIQRLENVTLEMVAMLALAMPASILASFVFMVGAIQLFLVLFPTFLLGFVQAFAFPSDEGIERFFWERLEESGRVEEPLFHFHQRPFQGVRSERLIHGVGPKNHPSLAPLNHAVRWPCKFGLPLVVLKSVWDTGH
jgi:hypothetical protein